MDEIEKTFDSHGYSITKTNIPLIRQRKFSDLNEKHKTISLLHDKGLDTKWLEDDGHFYADFYLANPKKQENQLITTPQDLKGCLAG